MTFRTQGSDDSFSEHGISYHILVTFDSNSIFCFIHSWNLHGQCDSKSNTVPFIRYLYQICCIFALHVCDLVNYFFNTLFLSRLLTNQFEPTQKFQLKFKSSWIIYNIALRGSCDLKCRCRFQIGIWIGDANNDATVQRSPT